MISEGAWFGMRVQDLSLSGVTVIGDSVGISVRSERRMRSLPFAQVSLGRVL